ncbi:restriction endonuclease [Verrucomicrobiota bacterium sgz303538]
MTDPLYNAFDWSLLDDPGFKEDSVREELISPLLTRLGYTASSVNRIHRSKAVKHPFVYLGSRSYRIELIPDYLFQVSQKYRWVLDAKAPSENIRQGRNAQQAYSYAIHPEIRVRYFALCNGRDFTVFDIHTLVPTLDFPLRNIHEHWSQLTELLGPEAFLSAAENLNPDLGLHLHRLGMSRFETHHFILVTVPLIARITDTSYTIGGTYEVGDERFCASFDFDATLLPQLMDLLPADARAFAEDQLSRSPFTADLRTFLPHATISCQLGKTIEWTRNKSEAFCPFRVTKFSQ